MSSDIEYFDVEERRKEKARARAEDEARIAAEPSARAEQLLLVAGPGEDEFPSPSHPVPKAPLGARP